MSLTMITGLPGSDTKGRVSDLLGAAALEGRRALLVVPSSAHATRVRAGLAEAAPVGLGAISFGRLVDTEWLLQGDGRSIAAPLRRDILLMRALVEAGVAEKPGPGAVVVLDTLASRACAQGPVVLGRVRDGLPGRLSRALDVYLASLKAAGMVEPTEATRLLGLCLPPADVVALESFTSLSPDRVSLLEGWSSAGCEILVSLPWRAGCPATQPLDALVDELSACGAGVIDVGASRQPRHPELERIVTDLFSAGPPASAQGKVLLGIARGDEAEARLISDRVVRLLSDGTPAASIAVAFGDPERHTGWLRRAFDEAGIEALWEVRVPVPETPLGRSMLRLWSLASGPMCREDFSALLRSPFCGMDAAQADRVDVTWRSRRVQGRALLETAGAAGKLVSRCGALADQPVDLETAKKWKHVADELMANAYGRDATVPGMDGAIDAAVHRAFCQTLTASCGASDTGITAREMWAAFASASVSPTSAGLAAGVLVTSITRLGLRDLDAVIIGGLTASEVPRQGSDDRLEGEAVRTVMRDLGLAHEPEAQARAERLAFYLAATAAHSSLVLVRRESDDEGRVLRPSVFWDEFLDLYREPGADASGCHGMPDVVSATPGPASHTDASRRPVRGILADERSLALLTAIDAVSPGEIERYAGCPYQWFVERRLRPKTPDAAVDVLTAGQVAHAALAEFYRRWPESSGRRRIIPDDVDHAAELMHVIASEAVAAAPAPTSLDEEWLLSSIGPTLAHLVARDARFLPDFEPAHLEWSFGLADGDEPIDLGGVKIKGRADRLDIGPQGVLVIDYKRSAANSLAQIRKKGLVQLQLYAVAASLRLGLPVAGGLYRSLSHEEDRGFVLDEVPGSFMAADVVGSSEMQGLLDEAVRIARDALDGMRSGHIEPSPALERCKYCAALPFCSEGVRS